jgi:c-di-GMP-binding flagellar brake protein YcgR
VKTLPRPLARTRVITRSGTEATIIFMRQKMIYIFLTFKDQHSKGEENPLPDH